MFSLVLPVNFTQAILACDSKDSSDPDLFGEWSNLVITTTNVVKKNIVIMLPCDQHSLLMSDKGTNAEFIILQLLSNIATLGLSPRETGKMLYFRANSSEAEQLLTLP